MSNPRRASKDARREEEGAEVFTGNGREKLDGTGGDPPPSGQVMDEKSKRVHVVKMV